VNTAAVGNDVTNQERRVGRQEVTRALQPPGNPH
jgi:hypothetical protein